CDNPRRKPLQALRATRAAVNTSPYRQSSRPRSENKNGSLRSRFYYYRESARKGWRVDPGHVFHHAHDLAAVAELVVVPDVQHDPVVHADGRFRIDHAGIARTDEIGRHHFLGLDEIDLL